jgi:hypothetical protein
VGRWVLLLIAAAMSFAGIALAAGGGSANVTLCADKHGGDLTLGSKGKCGKGEKKVTIAKVGPQGEQGASGANGTTASIQPEEPIVVAAATGDCAASPGTFCGGPAAKSWMELPGPVGGDGEPAVSYQKDAAGYVHLAGHPWLSNAPAGPDTSRIFYLPPGYRPSGDIQFAVSGCDISNATEAVRIDPNGGVVPSDSCVSLDGIAFHP